MTTHHYHHFFYLLSSNLLLLNSMCMSMYIGLFYFGFLIHEQLLIFQKQIKYLCKIALLFQPLPLIFFTYLFKECALGNFFHIFLQGMRIGVYFFKECALGCLSSRFLYLNFKERALGCGSSRFSCALSSNSNGLFGLWT